MGVPKQRSPWFGTRAGQVGVPQQRPATRHRLPAPTRTHLAPALRHPSALRPCRGLGAHLLPSPPAWCTQDTPPGRGGGIPGSWLGERHSLGAVAAAGHAAQGRPVGVPRHLIGERRLPAQTQVRMQRRFIYCVAHTVDQSDVRLDVTQAYLLCCTQLFSQM